MDVVTLILLIALSVFTIWGIGKEVNDHFGLNFLAIGFWCLGFNFSYWASGERTYETAWQRLYDLNSGLAQFTAVFSILVCLIGLGMLAFGVKQTADDVSLYLWRNKPSTEPEFNSPEEKAEHYREEVSNLRAASKEMKAEEPELAQALLDLAHATENLHNLKAEPPLVEKSPKKTNNKEIDQWTILERLGGGHFSEVYKATRKRKGPIDEVETVALKIIKPQRVSGLTPERFRQEQAILAKFDHQNIIRLVEYPKRKNSKEMWVATNYVSEWNFEKLIKENGKLAPRQLNNFVRQLFNGLAHAARRNIVHGDIKPANLLLSRDGETLVIADFGLSFNWKNQISDIHTDISYRAPELFLPRGDLTQASDVYSAAISIFEMASGRKVWSGTNSPDRIKTLALHVGPSWEGVPSNVREFIKPMLAADPKERPTLEEITSHLRDNNISPWKKGTKYFNLAAEYTNRQTAVFKK